MFFGWLGNDKSMISNSCSGWWKSRILLERSNVLCRKSIRISVIRLRNSLVSGSLSPANGSKSDQVKGKSKYPSSFRYLIKFPVLFWGWWGDMICGRVCDWQIDWNDNTNTPSYFFSFSPPNMSEDIYSAIHIWWRVYQSATSFLLVFISLFLLWFWLCSRRLFIDSGIVEPYNHPSFTSSQNNIVGRSNIDMQESTREPPIWIVISAYIYSAVL